MPKVSVVIPAYNAMKYLPETLESVLKQTFTDYEVLIINDGSIDNIEQWASQLTDTRVKLISQVNQGVSVARNTGITHAQGEYIAFLDADDLWEPTKLEQQVQCFEQNPDVGLVYTWRTFVDAAGQPIGRVEAPTLEGNVWEQLVVVDVISNGSSVMVRRACFDQVGLFDQAMAPAEDRDMWTRIALHYPFAVVKEPLLHYRNHSSGHSKNRSVMIASVHRVIEKTFQSAPPDRLYLKNRAYGWTNLFQAWNSIDARDYKEAMEFRQQAVLHYPQLRYTQSYIRLSLAIAMMQWFGPNGYDGLRAVTRAIHQRFVALTS